ncbi:MAG: hypothetical protein PHD95_01280 [Candidatus ainarchaeum sp.]|nr:hypothetical protein [Candidatus ainarchaeum sp.]
MNKGIFSGIIAAAAIMLIGAIIITTSANVKNSSNEDFAGKILEIKKEWNNAGYLLDKTLADKLADSVDMTACTFTAPAPSEIDAYFRSTIGNSIKNCNFQDVQIDSSAQANFEIHFALICSKKISNEFEIKKFEKIVAFAKKVELIYIPAPESCTITITDLQSGIVEVQKTV